LTQYGFCGVTVAPKSRLNRFLARARGILRALYQALYGLVLHSFRSINRRIKSGFPLYRMHEETAEHVRHAVQVFIWLILPFSLAYLFGLEFFLRQNALGSMLWGLAVYFYSNFLPDLPSVYRKNKIEPRAADLPWYKKYAILLFAPLLVWLLFSEVRLKWRTVDTYHNFTSLAIYGAFLFVVCVLAFSSLPLSAVGLPTVFFVPTCGVIGFLTHLRVDEIW
jgi:hypothetical protein